jgi:HAD superfamily hydrolase (TIGR01509 family)
VTLDFWGTLLNDGPASDNRYRFFRLSEFQRILSDGDRRVHRTALERGYDASTSFLAKHWRTHRDVPVIEHVRAILGAADPQLLERLPAAMMTKLIDAYSRPVLVVPPALDPGTPGALAALRDQGLTLAVVSNTMRTPGATLRKLLAQFGILEHFAHTTFSDEVGIRKPAPEIFGLTLRAVGGDPATAVHVGDDAVLDVEGARATGMRVIQVTTETKRPKGKRAADIVISKMAALPAAVAELQGR